MWVELRHRRREPPTEGEAPHVDEESAADQAGGLGRA
jgi:hypothetical protein